MTILFYVAVLFAACSFICLAQAWQENRERRRRMKRLRERRQYLDGLEPKRWTT